MAKKTPKVKFLFDESERKFHILTAFKLYQVEMYIMQKANQLEQLELGEKTHKFYDDYVSSESIQNLFETVAVFEPEFYETVKKMDVTLAIIEILGYLRGEKIDIGDVGFSPTTKANPSVSPGAKSDAADAIMAKDLKDPKKIIVTKSMPQRLNKENYGK